MTRFLTSTRSCLQFALIGTALGLCGLVLAGCSKPSVTAKSSSPDVEAKKTAPVAVPTKVNQLAFFAGIPRAAFSTNISDGRDPFFPESTLRLPRVAKIQGKSSPRQPQMLSNHLKVTALYPSPNRPVAMINKTTVAPGEIVQIPVVATNSQGALETHRLTVRCLEIRETSVVISVEGEPGTKELVLRPKF